MNYKIIGGDGKEYGPATAEELKRWFDDGRLNGQSLVRVEPGGEWQPLRTLPELAAWFARTTTPPPLPAASAGPLGAQALTAQTLSRPPQVAIGACLSRSWALLCSNFGTLAGACFLVWLLSLSEFIPLIGFVYRFIAGPLLGGLCLVFLKRIRGQPASAADALAGFGASFGQLLLAGFISWLLATIGLFFCVVPAIYLYIAWIFCVPLVADNRLEFWSAMELSRKVVTRVWFPMLGLLLIIYLPVVLAALYGVAKMGLFLVHALPGIMNGGQPDIARMIDLNLQFQHVAWPMVLLVKLIWLFNLPFAVGAVMYAYEDLFGARPTPAS